MTIHEIDEAILNCVDAETGEVDTDSLMALQMARDAKIEGIAHWCLELEGDNAKIAAEIKRLEALKRLNENKTMSLKDYLRFALAGQKFKGATVSITYRTTHPLAEISSEILEKLPDEYKTVKVEVAPDKRKIKAALDEGWHFDGVSVEERVSVIIK